MRSDTLRQVATVLSFLLTMAINVAANALPINGQRTGEISDRFQVFVIPAGYVFSIWGLIYLLLAAFTVWQALPRNREDETLRSLGWLPALTGVLNATWVLLFQYEVFALTVPVMIAPPPDAHRHPPAAVGPARPPPRDAVLGRPRPVLRLPWLDHGGHDREHRPGRRRAGDPRVRRRVGGPRRGGAARRAGHRDQVRATSFATPPTAS